VLIRHGGEALLLDAGTGVRRLVGDRSLLAGARRLDVLLTHFHLDHVCGLGYLPALGLPVTVHGPGAWLYGRSTAELLAPLRTAPLSPFTDEELGEVAELREGGQEIAGLVMQARRQPRHWAPTAGLRLGDELAYVTDTAWDEGSVGLARGVRLLLHEAWSCSAEPRSSEGDSTGADAGRVAAAAGVERLRLVHLNPTLPDLDAVLADARGAFPEAELGVDGERLL
jgi:ribonuclease BN (tRNA processing enzyme)